MIEEKTKGSGNVEGAGARPVPPKRAQPAARAIPAPSTRVKPDKDDKDKGKEKKKTRVISDAELRRVIALPINNGFGIWANLLHDDYYRLSEGELNDLVDPAVSVARDLEIEDKILKFAAPIALGTSFATIVGDRISYMLSPEGPDEAGQFDTQSKPEIRRTVPDTRAEHPGPQPIAPQRDSGYSPVPMTTPTTREGRLPDVTKGPIG